MKKNLADVKKKMLIKSSEIKAQSKELINLRKSLREAKSELHASQNETDAFYISSCKRWELFFTGFRYPGEGVDPDSARVRCLDRKTGTSVVANALDGKKARWSCDIGIPDEISEKAAEHILCLKLPTSPSD
ncbi:MAG: hypothetical protein OQK12_07050 [Motiliproteus sp.]|nr:hypothetical protein [Motiliproteus sp.]MCW9052344.1 hypothetical protein [Motiliproteus sp.]